MTIQSPTDAVWDELQHMPLEVAEDAIIAFGTLLQRPETTDLTVEPDLLRALAARLLRVRNDQLVEGVCSKTVDWDTVADRWLRRFDLTYLPEPCIDDEPAD